MSENLDLVRSIHADWERGDFSATEWAHIDLELVIADGPDPGQGLGVAASAEAWRNLLSAWENMRSEAEEHPAYLRYDGRDAARAAREALRSQRGVGAIGGSYSRPCGRILRMSPSAVRPRPSEASLRRATSDSGSLSHGNSSTRA
jgi:hypothetical protein